MSRGTCALMAMPVELLLSAAATTARTLSADVVASRRPSLLTAMPLSFSVMIDAPPIVVSGSASQRHSVPNSIITHTQVCLVVLYKLNAVRQFLPELDVAIDRGGDNKVRLSRNHNVCHSVAVHVTLLVHRTAGELVKVHLFMCQCWWCSGPSYRQLLHCTPHTHTERLTFALLASWLCWCCCRGWHWAKVIVRG